jgi:hypothetical protein
MATTSLPLATAAAVATLLAAPAAAAPADPPAAPNAPVQPAQGPDNTQPDANPSQQDNATPAPQPGDAQPGQPTTPNQPGQPTTPSQPGVTTPGQPTTPSQPGVTTPQPGVTTPQPGVTTPQPGVTTPPGSNAPKPDQPNLAVPTQPGVTTPRVAPLPVPGQPNNQGGTVQPAVVPGQSTPNGAQPGEQKPGQQPQDQGASQGGQSQSTQSQGSQSPGSQSPGSQSPGSQSPGSQSQGGQNAQTPAGDQGAQQAPHWSAPSLQSAPAAPVVDMTGPHTEVGANIGGGALLPGYVANTHHFSNLDGYVGTIGYRTPTGTGDAGVSVEFVEANKIKVTTYTHTTGIDDPNSATDAVTNETYIDTTQANAAKATVEGWIRQQGGQAVLDAAAQLGRLPQGELAPQTVDVAGATTQWSGSVQY